MSLCLTGTVAQTCWRLSLAQQLLRRLPMGCQTTGRACNGSRSTSHATSMSVNNELHLRSVNTASFMHLGKL